jgi:tRNA (mo5U34)-methyltransferase
MQREELERRINAFPRWHYRFEFDGGVRTPMADRAMVNRHEQRRRYFFDPLVGALGGSLTGHRVLDLGCNAGYWSLAAIDAGADFVLGVDAKPTFIEQAALVFEAKGVEQERYRFEQGNVFAHELAERFDVVFCLGLLEHVSKPVELFELFARVGAELVVIDTEVTRARSSTFHVEQLYDRESVVDHPLVLVPSRQALIELAHEFGFQTIELAQVISDYAGMRDYRRGRRLAFVCSKDAPPAGLPTAKAPSLLPWWASTLVGRGR